MAAVDRKWLIPDLQYRLQLIGKAECITRETRYRNLRFQPRNWFDAARYVYVYIHLLYRN